MTFSKRVAIIGGGPCGLAVAKGLMMEPVKFAVDLFDRRDQLGGLWYYDGDKAKAQPPVPSVDPNGVEANGGGFSSMYDKLETNLVDKLMEYSGVPFEPRTMKFLSRNEVLQYVHRYAGTIPEGVNYRLSTSVVGVAKTDGEWVVDVEKNKTVTTHHYDAVVVASGHTELPYIPDTPGIAAWNTADPGLITHARYFTDCVPFTEKTVLVVGNYASGSDLATQILTVAKKVYVSTNADELEDTGVDYFRQVRVVVRYDYADNRTVHFSDGTLVSGVDSVVFCTGYLYTLPFLRKLANLTDGTWVSHLYRQIFYVEDPTLSFVGLPKYISPLPFGEAQAAVVARVYSGRMTLPDLRGRREAYEAELAAKGPGKPFHSFKDTDAAYCNEMYGWIQDAGLDKEGLVPLWWDEERLAERADAATIKKQLAKRALAHAKNLRALGQPYDFPEEHAIE